jgi:outer membrane protein assembly factor BamB
MKDDNNYRLTTLTAAIAGVFSLIVCALLLYDYGWRGHGDPLENQSFQTLKAALAKQPDNEELKSLIRDHDLQLRQEYFRHRAFTVIGAFLLIGGVAIFLASAKTAVTLRRKLPQPHPLGSSPDIESRWTQIGRRAVGVFALVLVATAIAISFLTHLEIPGAEEVSAVKSTGSAKVSPTKETQSSSKVSTTSASLPPYDESVKEWPCFRGPGGSGISAYTNISTEWDVEANKNIRWKTPVPLPGNNSPVVWMDRVFVTGADKQHREVYCFDAASGKLLWQKEVPGTPQSISQVPKVNIETGYAASTAATDGQRVFAIFANGDMAAFDFDGKLAWSKSFGPLENSYGHASSLSMYKNLLITQLDQGDSGSAGKSKLFAFDSSSGKTVWQTDRPVPNSWSSPIVIRYADHDQIVTAASPWVISYEPDSGKEIWRAKCLQQDVGPSPVFAASKVFAVNESPALSAIRVDGQGDVTDTNVVWKGEDDLPDICSPLANNEFVFLLTSYGTLTCYDAEKGDQLWAEDLGEDCNSSPSLVGKLLYVFAKSGKAWVVEPNREKCQRIAECNLGEECVTSPAFQDGCFYIRGKNNLICIGNK